VALASSLTIYITSYLEVSTAFAKFMREHNVEPELLLDSTTRINILILSILVGLVIASIAFIFTYYNKVIKLYHMQQNFINGFTHELKTPVTSIKLYLDTFTMHELDRETQLRYIGFMQRDANRLSDNISKILNLAKIEDKKFILEYERITIGDYIHNILTNNEHIFEGADIVFEGDPKLFIFIDKALIETLFMNLLINAITYNNSVRPQVTITASIIKDNISITVKDNGIGLSAKDRYRIFKKFYRVKKAVKGSGIGLYLSQQIVRLHDGNIRVESQGQGHGSIFRVTIPQDNSGK